MAADQGPYGNCPNDSMFYEQQEFCNYLGLTELATANAVATAMRELANSTVARRSLRVRPQQQLDRMRSDVRGKRRERERQQDKDRKIPLTTSSELSTDKEESSPPQIAESAPVVDDEMSFNKQLPAEHQRQLNHFYDYFRKEGDRPALKSPTEQERPRSRKLLGSERSSKEREMCQSPKVQKEQHQISPKKSTQEQASSQSAERPVHRRYLQILPTEETIVLDDDDDDCYEVVGMDNASVTTLIPEEELEVDQQPEEEGVVQPDVPDLKNTESQTSGQHNLTKKTSTTDLEGSAVAPTAGSSAEHLDTSVSNAQPCATAPEGTVDITQPISSDHRPSEDRQLANAVLDAMRQQVQMQQQQFLEHKMLQQPQMYHYPELPLAPQGRTLPKRNYLNYYVLKTLLP